MNIGDLVEVENQSSTGFKLPYAGLRGRIHYITRRTHPVAGTLIMVNVVLHGERRQLDIYSNELRLVTALDQLVEAL
jgi:hypothetical protein